MKWRKYPQITIGGRALDSREARALRQSVAVSLRSARVRLEELRRLDELLAPLADDDSDSGYDVEITSGDEPQ